MFREILKETVEGLPGAVGAIFADWEGECVEQYFGGPDDEIKLIGAHQGILLNLAGEASDGGGLGAVDGMIMETEKVKLAVRMIKDGYYLVLLLDRRASLGAALRAAEGAAQALRAEI